MKDISDGIRVLPGSTDILVVAPHGPFIEGEYQNDIRTGIIAQEIHKILGCYAIINDRFFKPKGVVKKNAEKYFLDLYRVDHSRKVPGYIDCIMDVANSDGKTLVLWIHGISDEFAVDRGKEHRDMGLFDDSPEAMHALIAYGQGGDPKTGDAHNSFSAGRETIKTFQDHLTLNGMTTILTHRDCNNYRGRDKKRFNQYFLLQGFGFDKIESIQLETKESGFRDSRENAIKTARIISNALCEVCRKEK